MMFNLLIATIASVIGPVTDYGSSNMTNHVSAEYISTGDNQCTLGVTFTLRNAESSIIWDKAIVKTTDGALVKVIDDVERAQLPADGLLVRGAAAFASRSKSSVIKEPKTSYIFISPAPMFEFDTSVAVYVNDHLTHVETATIYCNVDACECSVRGYPERRF